jgi:selT/selW/selH-like putative selenoprotein
LAADLESTFQESSQLIQSSGGVFEIERDGQLIYSKKATSRFPEDGEVIAICNGVDKGLTLEQAQNEAAKNISKPPSFGAWLGNLFKK